MILYTTKKFQFGGRAPKKREIPWAPGSNMTQDGPPRPSHWTSASVQRAKTRSEDLMQIHKQRIADQGMRNYYNNYTPTPPQPQSTPPQPQSTPPQPAQKPSGINYGGQSNFVHDMYGMSEYDRNSYLYGSDINPSHREIIINPGTQEWYKRMNDSSRTEEDRAMYRGRLQSLNDKIMSTGFEPTPY